MIIIPFLQKELLGLSEKNLLLLLDIFTWMSHAYVQN